MEIGGISETTNMKSEAHRGVKCDTKVVNSLVNSHRQLPGSEMDLVAGNTVCSGGLSNDFSLPSIELEHFLLI